MKCTVDASVFVAAARTEEVHHDASLHFLQMLQARNVAVFCPTLILAECAAAIARPTREPQLAMQLVSLLATFPSMQLLPLSEGLAYRAAYIAAQHSLRGADAVYVAVAEAANAALVTWDAEMLQRGRVVVPTLTPPEWVETFVANDDVSDENEF